MYAAHALHVECCMFDRIIVALLQGCNLVMPRIVHHISRVRSIRQRSSGRRHCSNRSSTAPNARAHRPTHFVALPLANEQVQQRIEDLQAHLTGFDKRFAPACLAPATAHVTLSVLQCDRAHEREQAEHAAAAIRRAVSSCALGSTLQLRVNHVDTFGYKVLFLGLEDNDGAAELRRLVQCVRSELHSTAGFMQSVEQNASFVPHITVCKMSKMRNQGAQRKRNRSSDARSLQKLPLHDLHLTGYLHSPIDVAADRVQLCRLAPRRADGWFQTDETVHLCS